jgi:hypothetical protein
MLMKYRYSLISLVFLFYNAYLYQIKISLLQFLILFLSGNYLVSAMKCLINETILIFALFCDWYGLLDVSGLKEMGSSLIICPSS